MRTLLLGLCLTLAACSGGAPDAAVTSAAPAADPAAAPPEPAPAPTATAPVAETLAPASTPSAEAPLVAEADSAAAPAPDAARKVAEELLTKDGVYYGCKTDDDCQVKDVGNCCGYYPACVNKDSPTFPDQVKAKCAAEGTSSICGFPDISGCSCVEGRCAPLGGPGGAVQ